MLVLFFPVVLHLCCSNLLQLFYTQLYVLIDTTELLLCGSISLTYNTCMVFVDYLCPLKLALGNPCLPGYYYLLAAVGPYIDQFKFLGKKFQPAGLNSSMHRFHKQIVKVDSRRIYTSPIDSSPQGWRPYPASAVACHLLAFFCTAATASFSPTAAAVVIFSTVFLSLLRRRPFSACNFVNRAPASVSSSCLGRNLSRGLSVSLIRELSVGICCSGSRIISKFLKIDST